MFFNITQTIFTIRNKFLIYFERETRDLIRSLCGKKRYSVEKCDNAGGKVVTYGSFHLGVHSRGKFLVVHQFTSWN